MDVVLVQDLGIYHTNVNEELEKMMPPLSGWRSKPLLLMLIMMSTHAEIEEKDSLKKTLEEMKRLWKIMA